MDKVYESMSLPQMKRINRENGSHWFDPDSMRFFGSRICESTIMHSLLDPHTWYFVSSERCNWGEGTYPRKYTIRSFYDVDGDINTVGEFQAYTSRAAAVRELRRVATQPTD